MKVKFSEKFNLFIRTKYLSVINVDSDSWEHVNDSYIIHEDYVDNQDPIKLFLSPMFEVFLSDKKAFKEEEDDELFDSEIVEATIINLDIDESESESVVYIELYYSDNTTQTWIFKVKLVSVNIIFSDTLTEITPYACVCKD